jgi:hypothetical protein
LGNRKAAAPLARKRRQKKSAEERISQAMKSIKWVAVLFLLNNEIVSWVTLTVLVVACLVWFAREVDRAQR